MKGLFPQYAGSFSQDYGKVWSRALFVFDTNVLLNLYRYRTGTRDELLNVLEHLSARIWIPHHVALEFQRNRLKVIAEQGKLFSEVRRTIDKTRKALLGDLEKLQLQKRHSLINPQPLLDGFEKLVDDYFAELDRLKETQQKLSAPDPLKEKIEAIFDGRVGAAPKDQAEIDELYKDAERRFRLEIPPGYKDADKDKDELAEYVHGQLTYKRKYGDYLVWKQLLCHVKANKSKSVILVTDDAKQDWWWKIDSDGPKKIGPRPELIEEARLASDVDSFIMYNPEEFLKHAKKFLEAQVSDETLREVRDVSTARHLNLRIPPVTGIGGHSYAPYLPAAMGSTNAPLASGTGTMPAVLGVPVAQFPPGLTGVLGVPVAQFPPGLTGGESPFAMCPQCGPEAVFTVDRTNKDESNSPSRATLRCVNCGRSFQVNL